MKQAGEFCVIELQVPFKIVHNEVKICKYVADFVTYDNNGVRTVIDCKGFKTPIYNLKKKLVKAFYGIDIVEC